MVADAEALSSFEWHDQDWMRRRAETDAERAPMSVYEVHPESWQRIGDPPRAPSWDELADRLIPYAAGMGFTHIELMPVAEYPFGGSWGYQPLSPFAPSARFGPVEGFSRFVDRAHAAGLGVIVDWVAAHFPTDPHGLGQFDGTALYEHADPREGFHPDWNTLVFNLGRHEVRGFLIAAALAWVRDHHVDGLRVDAVASMLYRDYSRASGEWVPNVHGGRENLESIAFLRGLNDTLHGPLAPPGVLSIAEESTAWPGVTAPTAHGGLGFDFKWNMGWMHDTLSYLGEDPIHRRHHHDRIGFGLVYAFSERFVLPLSHDEVVHGKRSLLAKVPGDAWQRFATLRAYYGFMWAHPGKKLLFMGGEFAQPGEFSHDGQPPLGPARRARASRRAAPGARPEPPECRRTGLVPARQPARGIRLAGRRRRQQQRLCLPAPRRQRPRAGRHLQLHPGAARGLPSSGCRRAGAGPSCSTPTARPTAAPIAATAARSRRRTCRRMASPGRRSCACRRWPRSGCARIEARASRPRAARRIETTRATTTNQESSIMRAATADRLEPGRPYPLGANWNGLGINFAVFSAHATRIQLCLFDATGRKEIARLDLPECTDEIWHGYLPGTRIRAPSTRFAPTGPTSRSTAIASIPRSCCSTLTRAS